MPKNSSYQIASSKNKGVTVIIPFRNEAAHLSKLLAQIESQDYPNELLEIILVDDHSNDLWMESLTRPTKGLLKIIQSPYEGKKYAIRAGVLEAKYEIILTTDADCSLSPQWVSSMTLLLEEKGSDLLFGPVTLQGNDSFLNNFQTIDYMAMAAIGAGASNMGMPFMCSGANLMFRKRQYLLAFKELRLEYLSGDDVFLLHAFKHHNFSVAFAQMQETTVYSETQSSWQSLINQRVRWGSKASGYKNSAAIAVSLVVFITNFTLAMSLLFAVCCPTYFLIVLFFWGMKMVLDAIFLGLVHNFFKLKWRWGTVLSVGSIYPFWITYIAIKGFFCTGSWKGRSNQINAL